MAWGGGYGAQAVGVAQCRARHAAGAEMKGGPAAARHRHVDRAQNAANHVSPVTVTQAELQAMSDALRELAASRDQALSSAAIADRRRFAGGRGPSAEEGSLALRRYGLGSERELARVRRRAGSNEART